MQFFSTAEGEYKWTIKASCEAVWLCQMLGDMQMSTIGLITLFIDNEGVIKLARNPVFHEQTKHVNVHYHYTTTG